MPPHPETLDRSLAEKKGPGSLLAACLLLLALACPAAAAARKGDPVFKPLPGRMAKLGVKAATVRRLLRHRVVKFEDRLLARLLGIPEHMLDYGQFLRARNVNRARRFARRHRRQLRRTSRRTGVPGPVVVAILSIESRLGGYTGRWSVFNVLASQAVLDTARAQALLVPHWGEPERNRLAEKSFQKRLAKRAKWAQKELAALLELSRRQGVSPHEYTGSAAGALGMPQFVPSSILRWGDDGNGDGRVNLHHPADAIRSVGRYLRAHGWRPRMSRQKKARVIYSYNNSWTYVRTVLELARRLR